MNTDLILKLIRLANNNPNDNEANLAARKVCSLLKDYTFGGANASPKNTDDWPNSQRESIFDILEKMHKAREAAYRQREQERKERVKNDDWWANMGYDKNPFEPPPIWDIPFSSREPPRPEVRLLKCTVCGAIINTAYVGNLFVCYLCRWKENNPDWKERESV